MVNGGVTCRKVRLLGLDGDADPFPAYARLRREEPVCRLKLRDGLHCWLISGYDGARAALADPRLSRDPRAAVPRWRETDRGRPLEDRGELGAHLLTREPPDTPGCAGWSPDASPLRCRRIKARWRSVRHGAPTGPRQCPSARCWRSQTPAAAP
jgi:hypothetical protein